MSEGSEKMKDLKEKTLKSLGLGYPKKAVNPRSGMFGERKVSKAKKAYTMTIEDESGVCFVSRVMETLQYLYRRGARD